MTLPIVLPGRADAPWVLTCEHASDALPDGVRWPPADRRLIGTHWTFDLGIADITRQLAAAMGAPAVLATVSRLWVDLNRAPDDPTLIRDRCDGEPVALNAHLTDADRWARLRATYHPFHDAVNRVVAAHPRADVLSMHSFTPVYEGGAPRPMELGVLFDREEALALRVAAGLRERGFIVALNEPYAGKGGLMYSAQTHADAHGRKAFEMDVRQDLAVLPAFQDRVATALAHILQDPDLIPARS